MEERILTKENQEDSDIVYLLFYENQPSIILGRSLKQEEEIIPNKGDIPILRRISGGGSVVHFSGNLNYSLIFSLSKFPHFFPIHTSYVLILRSLCRVFQNQGFHIHHNGLSDLCVTQGGTTRKISGNSQARKRGKLMHHGTFLYQPNDRHKIAYYLKRPPKEPDYRKGRRHEDFMILTPLNISKFTLIRMMTNAFQETFHTSQVNALSNL